MKLLLACVAIAATGCIVDDGEGEEDFDEESSEVVSSNRIALNGLTLDRSLLGAVASGSLSSAPTRVPALFTTPLGREQFKYLVSCALRPDQSVSATVAGVRYTFAGSLGVVQGWSTSPLSMAYYRWVSACLLSRANHSGVAVPISLRTQGVSTPNAEKSAYTVGEGAFWGNVFVTTEKLYACASPLKLSGSTLSTLPLRECAVSTDGVMTKCGFTYGGDCSKICSYDSSAGAYKDCTVAGIKGSSIVTVYLAKP